MSAACHEIMSLEELCRRLSEVRRGEEHLKMHLPLDSPHNAILRLRDIVAYTQVEDRWMRDQFPDMYRLTMPHSPNCIRRSGEKQRKPIDKAQIEDRQRELSRFFYGWDAGTLVKMRVGDGWRIVGRHQNQVPLGAAPRPAADARMIQMAIGSDNRLRFK